jgi:hypothetical protein
MTAVDHPRGAAPTPPPVKTPRAATTVKNIPSVPTSIWLRATRVSSLGLRVTRSAIARISILVMLDPKRSPTANDALSCRTALMSVRSSGSDVAAPTHIPPSPVLSAMLSPSLASRIPAPATAAALMRKVSHEGT